jgi:hypothetical protein
MKLRQSCFHFIPDRVLTDAATPLAQKLGLFLVKGRRPLRLRLHMLGNTSRWPVPRLKWARLHSENTRFLRHPSG